MIGDLQLVDVGGDGKHEGKENECDWDKSYCYGEPLAGRSLRLFEDVCRLKSLHQAIQPFRESAENGDAKKPGASL